jgi:hypothetical protein
MLHPRTLIASPLLRTSPLFYAVPTSASSRAAQLVPLYQLDDASGKHAYAAGEAVVPGFTRAASPLVYVWPTPIRVRLPVADYLGELTADAGSDQCLTVAAAKSVRLDGSASRSARGDSLRYRWTRSGESCALAESAQLSLGLGAGVHGFELEVTDEHGAVAHASVIVSVH